MAGHLEKDVALGGPQLLPGGLLPCLGDHGVLTRYAVRSATEKSKGSEEVFEDNVSLRVKRDPELPGLRTQPARGPFSGLLKLRRADSLKRLLRALWLSAY
jgi:hypothetical protein